MPSEKDDFPKEPVAENKQHDRPREDREQRYSIDVDDLKKQVILHTFRASGPGGQHRNVTDSGVRIVHKLSGVVVTATESRSQLQNKEKAFERLIVRLKTLNRTPKRRIPTKKTRAARERELDVKHRHQTKKKMRGRPEEED